MLGTLIQGNVHPTIQRVGIDITITGKGLTFPVGRHCHSIGSNTRVDQLLCHAFRSR
jgi:hypothetical protein